MKKRLKKKTILGSMTKNTTLEKIFTRKAYQKTNSLFISIPIEITRALEVSRENSFIVKLEDGMIIYKPVDTTINTKRIQNGEKQKPKKEEPDVTDADSEFEEVDEAMDDEDEDDGSDMSQDVI